MRLVALALLASQSSCVLVTGSTSGYVVEAGAATPSCTAGANAGADAGDAAATGDASCSGLVLNCLSAANCADAGQGCCVVPTGAAVVTTCSALPCPGSFPIQACQTNAECGSAGACTKQKCTFGGASSVVSLCGTVPLCTPE